MKEKDKIDLFQEVCSALQKKIKDKGKVTMVYERKYRTVKYSIEFINHESVELGIIVDDKNEHLLRFPILYQGVETDFKRALLSRYGFA